MINFMQRTLVFTFLVFIAAIAAAHGDADGGFLVKTVVPDGAACTGNSDCTGSSCVSGVCRPVGCNNGSQDGDKLTSVNPDSADGISGWGFTNTDDGDATNTKATSKAGDYIIITSGGLAGGMKVASGRGVWAGA